MIETIKQRIIYLTNKVLKKSGFLIMRPTENDMAQSKPTRDKIQSKSLLRFYANIYSQRGQDGILREIFSRLNIEKGNFAEFGACDGVLMSNCRLLYEL